MVRVTNAVAVALPPWPSVTVTAVNGPAVEHARASALRRFRHHRRRPTNETAYRQHRDRACR